jgi:hypothetical protein
MLMTFASFFNEIAIEKRNYAHGFYFIFNYLSIEKRKYAHGLFLIMDSKRIIL